MIGFMFFLDLILVTIIYGLFIKKVNIIELIVPSMLLFFMQYIVIAGFFWWIDNFSIVKTLFMAILADIVFIVFEIKGLKRKSIKIHWEIKLYFPVIIIVLCVLPFTFQKFEYFGMGQDEGVYQTQAIQFIYGHTEVQQDIEEYEKLETETAKQTFKLAAEESLMGFYNYDSQLPFASEKNEISEVSGIFHGIATFPAILALWGEIFGISHMSDVQTIFFVSSIFLCFLILQQLKIKKWLSVGITALFAFSPLVLWSSKSALTEIVLTSMITLFIYFILKKERKYIFCSIIPLAAFCFFHITIYTVIPCFLMLYFGLYLYSNDKYYIYAAFILNTIFAAGIFMMMMTAGTYSFSYNFSPVYHLIPGATQKNIVYIIIGCCAVVYAMGGILLKIKQKTAIKKFFKYRNIWIRVLLIAAILNQIRIVLNIRELYQGGFGAIEHLSITGIFMAIGFIVPVLASVLFFIFIKRVTENVNHMIVVWLFLYCIVFYCSVMKTHIEYYYYYGRYLVPYLIIILLISAIALNCMNSKLTLAAVICSGICIIPYDLVFLNYQDDTRIEWDVLEAIPKYIDNKDNVFVSEEDMKYFFFAVRAMTGAQVYPDIANIREDVQDFSDGNNIYYLSSNSEDKNHIIYENIYFMEQDNNHCQGKIFPFPTKMESEERRFVITKIK